MSTSRLDQLQALLAESPDDAFLLYAIAKEYESSGDNEQALGAYQDLCTRHPDYVGTYYHLGKLHERMQQPAQALAVYHTGISAARKANDHHALSELTAACLALDDED